MTPAALLPGALAVLLAAGNGEPAAPGVPFTDVTESAGIAFVHQEGAAGEKLLPETMGGGVAFFDYDRDGDPDLLFVDSGEWPPPDGADDSTAAPSPGSRRPLAVLYANESTADGIRFRDVTEETGLSKILASPASPSYGQGVAVGDSDGDGWLDLYLTAAGPNRLLRNREGKFEDVTTETGTSGGDAWSTGAAFFDGDGDGDLDLVVGNYLEWSPALDRSEATVAERTVALGEGETGLTYGRPQDYRGMHPFLFVNGGDGTFTERSGAAGLHVARPAGSERGPVAKALAVAPADVDRDGRIDLLVANDTTRNLFFHNRTSRIDRTSRTMSPEAPRFEETGELSGLAYDADGRATGAMGVDWAEPGDGALAFVIGNFADEASSLYRAQGDPTFWADQSMAAGLAAPTRAALTFAVLLFDPDLDGRLDLLQVNGHVEPDIARVDPKQRYRQPAQLFRSEPPEAAGTRPGAVPPPTRWHEVPPAATADLARPIAGRGGSYADVDGDGDLDLAITQIGGRPLLLRNDQATGHRWLRLRLVGEPPNRHAVGARVALTAGGRTQTRDLQPARGYLSSVELPLTFGLGEAEMVEEVEVEVVWPDGTSETFEIEEVDRLHELVRGAGAGRDRGGA